MGFPNQAQHFFLSTMGCPPRGYAMGYLDQGLWFTRVCHMDIGYMVIVYWLDGYMAMDSQLWYWLYGYLLWVLAMRFAYCLLAIGYMVLVMVIGYIFKVWFFGFLTLGSKYQDFKVEVLRFNFQGLGLGLLRAAL